VLWQGSFCEILRESRFLLYYRILAISRVAKKVKDTPLVEASFLTLWSSSFLVLNYLLHSCSRLRRFNLEFKCIVKCYKIVFMSNHTQSLTHSLVNLPRRGLATADDHSDIFLLHCAQNGDLQTLICVLVQDPAMSLIVESCPLTKLNGSLSRLLSADEDAVSWLTSYGS